MPSNHLIICSPLLPSIFPSIRVFSSESTLYIRWPEDWSFSFNISLLMNIQDWSPLGWTGLISMHSKLLSRVFSSTTVQKHEFFGVQPSLWLNFHICTWLLENHSFDFMDLCQQSDVSAFCCSVWVCHSFPYKEQVSFNFMAAVTIPSDFEA